MRSLVNLSDSPIPIPKIHNRANGYIAAKLVKPGDAVFISNKLFHVIETTNNAIVGVEINAKNKQITYEITDKNEKIRFLYLDPKTFNDRKVFVDTK